MRSVSPQLTVVNLRRENRRGNTGGSHVVRLPPPSLTQLTVPDLLGEYGRGVAGGIGDDLNEEIPGALNLRRENRRGNTGGSQVVRLPPPLPSPIDRTGSPR